MAKSIPSIGFLGYVERYSLVQNTHPRLWKYNILGFKQIIFSYIYPLTLRGGGFAFSIYDMNPDESFALKWRDNDGVEAATMNFRFGELPFDLDLSKQKSLTEAPIIKTDAIIPNVHKSTWAFLVLPVSGMELTIPKPGLYHLWLLEEGSETKVGSLNFGLINPEPLSEARIAAIRSDPRAAKGVHLVLSCKMCGGSLKSYAGLEQDASLEGNGFVWYQNLPGKFVCDCGKLEANLTIIRSNLHGLLGQKRGSEDVTLIPSYERDALDTIRTNFCALLDQKESEEILQKFLEENPVLLHEFSPSLIFFKAPLLSFYKTDFTILSHAKELILIELEKPHTQILKKDGGVHSDLQHAFDQARNWLHTSDEHRLAVLECIRLDQKQVGSVRAVVIAGRDVENDPEHLRKLKGIDFGRIKFLTYDDLLGAFDALLRALDKT
ncbi:MAG: DUF4263 domain-containing protein [Proteobacteria bacterium]|nr:DUF4263 domain-containing protein [Pseudomonadota bacterium]